MASKLKKPLEEWATFSGACIFVSNNANIVSIAFLQVYTYKKIHKFAMNLNLYRLFEAKE